MTNAKDNHRLKTLTILIPKAVDVKYTYQLLNYRVCVDTYLDSHFRLVNSFFEILEFLVFMLG